MDKIMVVDNYGNIIEEPFHTYKWCIEWSWRNGEWEHYRSYKKPLDVYKALNDLRQCWGKEFDVKFRPSRRTYKEIKDGSGIWKLYHDRKDNEPLMIK